MTDSLGDRMKANYEDRSRYLLPRRGYTIIRIDGKAFHTYTKGLDKPFDEQLIRDMDETAKRLCAQIQGSKFAFVQSDEISILLTDFDTLATDAWFNNNLQKMCSVSASIATAEFNALRPNKKALFDSRVFQIPSKTEVYNYFLWRQRDATRNSIQSVAQSLYTHREMNGKNTDQLQEMIFEKGINWNDLPIGQKRGRIIVKESETVIRPTFLGEFTAERTYWLVKEPPIFSAERELLTNLIPDNE